VTPVLGKSKFSSKEGFSLPPYLNEGSHDADVALHLPASATRLPHSSSRIRATRNWRSGSRPAAASELSAEWTQRVALYLQLAELKLALGETADSAKEGASELILLHKQLVALFDARTAAGRSGGAIADRPNRSGRGCRGLAQEHAETTRARPGSRDSAQGMGRAAVAEVGMSTGLRGKSSRR